MSFGVFVKLPCLQRDTAVKSPTILELDGFRGGGSIWRGGSRCVALRVPPAGLVAAIEGISRWLVVVVVRGQRKGRREVWLWWLDAPEREREKGDKSQNFSYRMLSAKCFRPQIQNIKLFRLLWFSATVICLLFSSHAWNVCKWKGEVKC